ncbi:MAG: hypothetical protein LBP75_06720 [Planctomycetota bacterium]|jgi:hypothetical protein|nr:hypothetical protein [Planctomycetota bacterium]
MLDYPTENSSQTNSLVICVRVPRRIVFCVVKRLAAKKTRRVSTDAVLIIIGLDLAGLDLAGLDLAGLDLAGLPTFAINFRFRLICRGNGEFSGGEALRNLPF